MKLYLDNCCYNRPYDSQESFRVNMETRAKLHIQEEINKGEYELVTSYMTDYENSKNPDQMKRDAIREYQNQHFTAYVSLEHREELQDKIKGFMDGYNLAYKDATHLACAIFAGCDYLLTTDIRFQRRYKGNEMTILNPTEFVQNVEEEDEL